MNRDRAAGTKRRGNERQCQTRRRLFSLLPRGGKNYWREFICSLGVLFFVRCGPAPDVQTVQESRILMDTLVSIQVYAPKPADELPIRSAITAAFSEMTRLDSLFSAYRNDSEVALINREVATPNGVMLSSAVDSVLHVAQWAAQISHGAFDVTVAPILRLWGFGTDSLKLPSPEQIVARLPLVGYHHLLLSARRINFRQPHMAIDLGGVAKGYVVDRGLEILQQAGIRDVMITAGGDLRVITSPLTAGRRYIWIRHPRPAHPDSAASSFFGRFKLAGDGAVSTSGDYERFFIHEGKRYHHIIDPHSGYPASGAVSATVLAKTSVQADALSTALFVLGPERGIALADSLPGVEAMMIYQTGEKLQWRATRTFQNILEK
ncbi:MAG: FAD:protein FMN transferase [bacterium]|nr:FAD:protein FMN transferase [bacterium]